MSYSQVAQEAAKAGGAVLKENYGKQHNIIRKEDNTPVTQIDVDSEQAIIAVIEKTYPDHNIFSEEAGMNHKDSDYTWIIDPLDGTTNFIHGLGHFATSVALADKKSIIAGAVFDPVANELFYAEEGRGAFFNDQPIPQVKPYEALESVISIGRTTSTPDRTAQVISQVNGLVRSSRIHGSTAIDTSYTAASRFQAFIQNDCRVYDFAAGLVMCQEIGLSITDFKGNKLQPDLDNPASTEDIVITQENLKEVFVNALKDT